MITRIWHGKTRLEDADKYLKYLQETGMKDYMNTPGNLGAEIWRSKENDICNFYTISRWGTIEDIKKFAGNDYEKARYYEDDKKYLLETEMNVMHCETFIFK
jgi:heme-degrading monooxygenase HmoA